MKKIIDWFKSPKSDIFLFIVAVVLLNLVASKAFFRIDLTAPRSYSLSRYSVETVKNLEDPLSIKVFFSDDIPAPYNGIETYIRDLMIEYKNKANKNFSYEFYDMKKEENEGIARDYDLKQYPIQEYTKNEVGVKQVWMGMVLTYADKIETLDGISSTDGLEYKITTTISKMISTVATLSGLKGSVNLNLYISKALENARIQGFSEIEGVVKDAHEKLNKNNMGKINLNVIYPESGEVEGLVEKYGLQGLRIKDENGNGIPAVVGLVIENGDDFRTLPIQVVSLGFFGNTIAGLNNLGESLEESLKSLVSKTVEIGYIIGHEELSIHDFEDPRSAANFANSISDMYTFREIDLSQEEIPSSIHTIVLNGPRQPISEYELYKLDQFLMKGGSLMVCQAPFNEIPSQNNNTFVPQNLFVPKNTGIERLLEKYGVKIEQNYVFDENCYAQINQQFGQKLNLYFAPLLQKENLAKHPISKNLGYVIFLENAALTITTPKENKDVKATILARSSEKSWTQTENIIFNPLYMAPPTNKLTEKSEILSVILEGRFESAFDEEEKDFLLKAAEEKEAEEGTESAVKITNHLKKSVQKGKIFVTGSEFVTSGQVIDEQGRSPIAIFLRNAVDYLCGNEELCKMRTKGLSLNTLKDTPNTVKNIAKIFNQYVIVVFVAIAGLIVWKVRSSRRKKIRLQYNPNDERIIEKNEDKAEN